MAPIVYYNWMLFANHTRIVAVVEVKRLQWSKLYGRVIYISSTSMYEIFS